MNFSRLSKMKTKKLEENNSNISSIQNIQYNNDNNNENEYNKILRNITAIEEKEIIIKTSNYIFQVEYIKSKSGNDYFTIFNDNNNYCIRIKRDVENPDDIYLQHLNFFESCAKNKSLIRKYGTIEMLLSLLEYIRDFYKIELKYIFQDDSSINILGHKLKLNLIYILLYGETWYMKNINAYSLSEEFNKNLESINLYLDNNKDNITKFFRKSFEYNSEYTSENNSQQNISNNETFNNNISNIVILEDFYNLINSKNNKNITKKQIWQHIKKIYKLSLNSREFLQSLYKKYGMSIFIILNYYEYYKYISLKLKCSIYFDVFMMIPNDFINNINVII